MVTKSIEAQSLLDQIHEWWNMKQQVDILKAKESDLRQQIITAAFPGIQEGTENADLPQGYKLSVTGKLNRNIDEAALPAVLEQMGEGAEDNLIERKPSLVMKEYRKLSDKQRKVFDQAL